MTVNVRDRKLVQLLSYLAQKNSSHTINKLKAIKLVWAADRYHLRKYGRLVSGDEYYALKYGPVASQLKNIAEQDNFLPDAYIEYANDFIHPSPDKMTIKAKAEVDQNLLSKTDVEALEFAWENFKNYSGFDLADISHKYPEWKKFSDLISSGQVAREKINPIDFFNEPEDISADPFALEKDIIESSKKIFIQNREVERALAL